jgi:hypothetical protein
VKRKQYDPQQLTLPFPPPPQKKKKISKWEPTPMSESPPSKPLKQPLLFWLFSKLKLNSDFFYWPSTKANPGDGSFKAPDLPETGPLHDSGYQVGEKGKPRAIRQAILTRVFELDVLPNLKSPDEIREWGELRSSERLKKMAYSIAAFCRNAKRRRRAWMMRAIDNYEDDLAWLKEKYYDGHFDQKFTWPRI